MQAAKSGKKDEFYTQRTDIEKELRHYKPHFRGKTVLCNCDDPYVSNFFRYFADSFEALGLKKLITTCYKSQARDLFSTHQSATAIKLEYAGDRNGNLRADPDEIGTTALHGDGDFRSPECVALLREADIVVTNPPFSLFREYVAQLVEHEKKFLIIGHQNAITYKEIFKLIKENRLWLGADNNGTKWFQVNEDYDITTESRKKVENGKKFFSMGSVVWFTNLDLAKRHDERTLVQRFDPKKYPHYDNFDAIEVAKVADIPRDYAGAMGVPITFLDKYNPDQFEILGNEYDLNIEKGRGYVDGKRMYSRIFIRNRHPEA